MPADTQYDSVHPLTVCGDKYGCHSRHGFYGGYFAPDGYLQVANESAAVRFSYINHTMSKACRNYYLWNTDPKCAGCTADKDTEYERRMRGME